MRTSDFDFALPEELIAQEPLEQRDHARLMHLDRENGSIMHRCFRDLLNLLRPGDLLLANQSRVIPARLRGRKQRGGGRVELLLLEPLDGSKWKAIVGGRRILPGTILQLHDRSGQASDISAEVTADLGGPLREVAFTQPVDSFLDRLGNVPLPPYIHQELQDPERYQTIYARRAGSSAAPTAGLHFTDDLLIQLRANGVQLEWCTLHIGLDTFKPVEASNIEEHAIHSEWAELTPDAARRINEAKLRGQRLVAVGTTSARVLETAALRSAGITGSLREVSARDAAGTNDDYCPWRPVSAFSGRTDLYIYPGYRYRVVDALITNFHLPRSSLLLMVSAFAGRQLLLQAYAEAIATEYRFFSFGDAMLIT
jgi:S-adenosylmethionine:tRNA ribosyltransferase-isomerase